MTQAQLDALLTAHARMIASAQLARENPDSSLYLVREQDSMEDYARVYAGCVAILAPDNPGRAFASRIGNGTGR